MLCLPEEPSHQRPFILQPLKALCLLMVHLVCMLDDAKPKLVQVWAGDMPLGYLNQVWL